MVTYSGEPKPVKWIGRRRLQREDGDWPRDVIPVKLMRSALDDDIPHRELRLSPNHGIYVDGQLIPGLPDADARQIGVPALVFRSGASDAHHTRATSESLAALLPTAKLVEPPWGDREWIERQQGVQRGGTLFERWHLLAGPLLEWANAHVR